MTSLDALLADQVRSQLKTLWAAGACAALAGAAGVLLLGLSGWFIVGAASAGAAGAGAVLAFNYLLPSAAIRLFAILRTAGRYGEKLLGHFAALNALAEIRPALFAAIANAAPSQALKLSTGEACGHLVNDINALESAYVTRSTWVSAAAAFAGGLGLVALVGWGSLTVFACGAALLLAGAYALARDRSGANVTELSASGALKDSVAAWSASSADLVCYDLAKRATISIEQRGEALCQAQQSRRRAEALLIAWPALVTGLTVAAIILAGGRANTAMLALAALGAAAALEGMGALAPALERRNGERAARARLSPLFDPSSAQRQRPTTSFNLLYGSRIALVGPSGSGKTTALEELVGLRGDDPPAAGLFAYAPQDARALTGTIRENLTLGAEPLEDEALWGALADACLDERVRSLPGELNAWVGDGGAKLSGGERRRLGIARALLHSAPWLVLDEPTEGLDRATELALLDRLAARLANTGQGLILTSHRPAPLALCRYKIDFSGKASIAGPVQTAP